MNAVYEVHQHMLKDLLAKGFSGGVAEKGVTFYSQIWLAMRAEDLLSSSFLLFNFFKENFQRIYYPLMLSIKLFHKLIRLWKPQKKQFYL